MLKTHTDFVPRSSADILSSPVADMDLATFLDLPIHDRERNILYRGFGCICGAINYLHKKKIRHEDLKPQNVLIHGDNLLLTDFGFSLDFSSDNCLSTTTGRPSAWTIRYSAPEVLNFEPRNRATDIWSLGCVLIEMVSAFNGTKHSDFKDRWNRTGGGQSSFARDADAIRTWFDNEVLGPAPEHSVKHLCFLIRSMLNENRIYRPTAQQVVDRIFDISLLVSDGSAPRDTACHKSRSCIGLSYLKPSKEQPFKVVSLRNLPDLVKYLHPDRYKDWCWGIFDLEWNVIYSDESDAVHSAQWPKIFSENSEKIKTACKEILDQSNTSGTTKPHWKAYSKANCPTLSKIPLGRLHAQSSAMMLSDRHAIFRRLSLQSTLWAGASKEQTTNTRSVQITLLPINLHRSEYFGSFFWKFSWPKERQEAELDDAIRDLTVLDWPR